MAKKPKKAGDEAEADAGAPPPRGKKKLILIGAVAVLALGGAGGYFAFARGGSHSEAPKAAKPVAFLDVREMTVNLAPEPNQDRPRYLKFSVALEVKDATVLPDVKPLLPRVEDSLQVFVRELRASDLEGSAGVYRLREELLRRINLA